MRPPARELARSQPAATELPGLLVCQETLTPLEVVSGGLWSSSAQRLYPVQDGLVYMGYPRRDRLMIEATMAEERDWQGTVATIERDAEFLRASAPRAVGLINLLGRYAPAGSRALELGSGSGWVSWLLATAGYDTYLCDFEANSLALGLEYEHPRMGTGRRIVADARYAPFPHGTFDVVVFKEFVHHVAEYSALFREANRVLRSGALLALMEPTMSVLKRIYQLRHPDPHRGHQITWPERYLRSLSRLGFEILHVGALYDGHEPRNKLRRAMWHAARRRAAADRPLDVPGRIHLTALGGAQLIVIARKALSVAPAARPAMTVIPPATMTTTSADREAYRRLRPILEQAAGALSAGPAPRP